MTYKHPATSTGWAVINASDPTAARNSLGAIAATEVPKRGAVDLRDWDTIKNGQWKNSLGANFTSGQYTLTNTVVPFTSVDVGKTVIVNEVVQGDNSYTRWMAKILSVSQSGVATLDTAAPSSSSGGRMFWGFDCTDAINSALQSIASDTPMEGYLPGYYRATQIVMPYGVTLRGAGWGSYGGTIFPVATAIKQLPGSQKNFVVFDDEGSGSALSGLTHINLFGPEPNVRNRTPTIGNGLSFRTPSGTGIIPQDGCEFSYVQAAYFPENGFEIPNGCFPLTLDNCRAFYNAKYGWDYNGVGGGLTQVLHLQNCSCDGNVLGGARFKDVDSTGTVVITGFKSEAHNSAFYGSQTDWNRVAGWPGVGNVQMSALVFDECTNSGVVINGVNHIFGGGLTAPGPAIAVKSSTTKRPNIVFNAVGVRLTGNETGSVADAVSLRDQISNKDIPLSEKSGTWPVYSPRVAALRDVDGYPVLTTQGFSTSTSYLTAIGSATPTLSANGQDANLPLGLRPKGGSAVQIFATTGNTPRLQASGDDANLNLNLQSKGTGKVQINSAEAVRRTTQTVTTATTLGANGDYIVFIGSSGAPILPTAAGNTSSYTFKNIHSDNRIVSTTSSQTIDGATTLTLPAGYVVELVSDGSNWRVISDSSPSGSVGNSGFSRSVGRHVLMAQQRGGLWKSSTAPVGSKVMVLAESYGSGIIQKVWYAGMCGDATRNSFFEDGGTIRVYLENDSVPAVEMNFNDFFCSGSRGGVFNNEMIGRTRRDSSGNFFSSCYRNTHIPFHSYMRVEVENTGTVDGLDIYMSVDYQEGEPVASLGSYKILSNTNAAVAKYTPFTICDYFGSGQVECIYISYDSTQAAEFSYLEGNISVYVDDETVPSILSTGTEDFFSGGYYSIPVGGYPCGVPGATDLAGSHHALYRFFPKDPIRFNTRLKVVAPAGQSGEGAGITPETIEMSGAVSVWIDTVPTASFLKANTTSPLLTDPLTYAAGAALPSGTWRQDSNKNQAVSTGTSITSAYGTTNAHQDVVYERLGVTLPTNFWAETKVRITGTNTNEEAGIRIGTAGSLNMPSGITVQIKRVSQYRWQARAREGYASIGDTLVGDGSDYTNAWVWLALKAVGSSVTAYYKFDGAKDWHPLARWTTTMARSAVGLWTWTAAAEFDQLNVYPVS